jgi:hypothetical protein
MIILWIYLRETIKTSSKFTIYLLFTATTPTPTPTTLLVVSEFIIEQHHLVLLMVYSVLITSPADLVQLVLQVYFGFGQSLLHCF